MKTKIFTRNEQNKASLSPRVNEYVKGKEVISQWSTFDSKTQSEVVVVLHH